MADPDGSADLLGRGWTDTVRGLSHALVVPHGFTLSVAGSLAITIEHRPEPGPLSLWLFVVAASLGFCLITLVSGAHRSPVNRPEAITGLALLNLTPIVVVPVAVLAGWWIDTPALAFTVVGLVTVVGYLVCEATMVAELGR